MITVSEIKVPPELMAIPEMVNTIIPDIVEAVRDHIIVQAHQRLTTSEQDYVENVQPAKYHYPSGRIPPGANVTVATIVLTGKIPNMIEQGWPGGDMKPFLLAGRNAKMTRGGIRYNTVPFRHGVPGVTGRNFPAMGSAYRRQMGEEAAARLGKRVYKAAKKLGPGERLPTPSGLAPKLRSIHTTDIYAGMIREEGDARSVQYMTFRRVSDRSDPGKWIHPGFEGVKLFEDAARYAKDITARMMGSLLRAG